MEIQDQVDNMRIVAKDFPDQLLNKFIFIYWKKDDVWYRAKIVKYLETTKKFKVEYDDRTHEKIDLTHEWFVIENEYFKAKATLRKRIVK